MSQSLARSLRRHPSTRATPKRTQCPQPSRLIRALAQRVEHVPLLDTELTSADLAFMALYEQTPLEDYDF